MIKELSWYEQQMPRDRLELGADGQPMDPGRDYALRSAQIKIYTDEHTGDLPRFGALLLR